MGTPKLRAKLPLLLLLLSLLAADGARKVWLKNTNWMNSANWKRGSLPCSKQVVSFEEKPEPYAVFVEHDVSVGELVLPMNGEIVFADDLKVNFGSFFHEPTCMAGENRFVGGEPEDWLNPHNWRVEDDLSVVPPMSSDDAAVPTSAADGSDGFPLLQAEVVPCTHDTVVFPENATYLVSLDHSKEVKQVDFTGTVYKKSNEFGKFLESENGKMQFKLGPSGGIAVQGQDCNDNSGCYCGNEEHMDKICDLYGDNCLSVTCSNPVTPSGSCCPMCGAVLLLSYDASTFDIMAFQDRLVDDYMLNEHAYKGRVKGRVSKLKDGHVQLALVDNVPGAQNGMAAGEVGKHIASLIEEDNMSPFPTFGVTSISIDKSGVGNKAQVAGGSGMNTVIYIAAGAGGGAVFFIAILVSLGIIIKKRREDSQAGQPGAASVRKQPMSAGGGPPGPAGQPGGAAGGPGADKGFENPVYDNPVKGDNPLYSDIPDDP
ncbi:protein amnionless-like isoform X2 [Branchiostoma floridae x Branchiostoma belcheri]